MRFFILFLLALPVLSGCVKNNPDPIWLQIDEWTLESNPASVNDPGALTHNFSDVWVYVDNKVIGVFELPCKIPVLASGENILIQLYPTIRNNGISATKKIYPFVENYEVTMDLVAGQTYHFSPTTRYYAETNFWIEDFESSSFKINTNNSISNASIVKENSVAISQWGSYGHIALTNTDSLWVGLTATENLNLPKSGAEVYLEINYYNTNSLLTGVLSYINGTGTDNPYISLNAQSTSDVHWKKIYIDLKEIISNTYTSDYYKIYLRALKTVDDTPSTDVYIDNIKLLYF